MATSASAKGVITMKIHAIQTGTVAVTRVWREAVGRSRQRRLLHTTLDREWTEPLPIYVFAIWAMHMAQVGRAFAS